MKCPDREGTISLGIRQMNSLHRVTPPVELKATILQFYLQVSAKPRDATNAVKLTGR